MAHIFHIERTDNKITLGTTGTTILLNSDLTTDRWLNSSTNIFLGINVVGANNLAAEGLRNIAIGNEAFYSNTTGNRNIAIGNSASYANTVGYRNVAIGYEALDGNTTGTHNTVIGHASFSQNIGSRNVMIGATSGYNQTTASNLLIIDNQNRGSIANEQTKSLIYGVFDVAVANQSLTINGLISGSYGAKLGDGGTTNYAEIKTDGEINLHGTARVTSHVVIDAAAMRITGGTHGGAGCFNYISFQNNQDDEAFFITHVPYRRAAGTDILVVLRWYYTGGNDNNTCEWNLTYNSIKAGEDPTGAGTALTEQAVAIATDDTLGLVTFTIPSAALEANDDLGIKIWRDGSDALTANALLIGAHVHFTMDKLGEATT